MWSISSQPTTRWQFITDDDAQLWQQLTQRHHQAIIQLRQRAASWGEQVAELKSQLSEIRALHQATQDGQQPPQSVDTLPIEVASKPTLGSDKSTGV